VRRKAILSYKVILGRQVRRWCVLAAVLAWAVAIVPEAQAHQIPGATYRGSLPNGGSLEFDVSGDGTSITRVRVSGRGDVCEGTLDVTGLNIPITNHAFNHSNADPVSFSGSFPSKQTAQGTLALDVDLGPPIGHCHAGPVSWTATTTSSPAGSEECKSAVGAVNAAQAQVVSAQAAASSAQDAADQAGAAIAADKHKIKTLHKKLRDATTARGKKKLQSRLRLATKALGKARAALAIAESQLQTATAHQQDAGTQLQVATSQQQVDC
jgi:hypothetical protein